MYSGYLDLPNTVSFYTIDDHVVTAVQWGLILAQPLLSSVISLRFQEKHVFYWLVEAPDPSTKPVALWTNGGPGCSGLIGFMTEQGPIRPTSDGGLEVNPASWHTEASMLFVEQVQILLHLLPIHLRLLVPFIRVLCRVLSLIAPSNPPIYGLMCAFNWM